MIEEDRTHHLETFKANMWDIGARLEVRTYSGVTQLVIKRPSAYDFSRSVVVFILVAIAILYLGTGGHFASILVPLTVAILGIIALVYFFAAKTKHLPRESVLLAWDANQQTLEAPMSNWSVGLDQIDGLGMKSVFAKGIPRNQKKHLFPVPLRSHPRQRPPDLCDSQLRPAQGGQEVQRHYRRAFRGARRTSDGLGKY